jgi:hypothetical protein
MDKLRVLAVGHLSSVYQIGFQLDPSRQQHTGQAADVHLAATDRHHRRVFRVDR